VQGNSEKSRNFNPFLATDSDTDQIRKNGRVHVKEGIKLHITPHGQFFSCGSDRAGTGDSEGELRILGRND
jgi:hypothetical protein